MIKNKVGAIRLTVFLDPKLYRDFKKVSKIDGRNMSNATRFLIRNYIAEFIAQGNQT